MVKSTNYQPEASGSVPRKKPAQVEFDWSQYIDTEGK